MTGNVAIASNDVSVGEADELIFRDHKRAFTLYSKDEFGNKQLVIYINGNEISFDDQTFFEFGETLVKQPAFIARSAETWGTGYAWGQLQPLFNALVEEGILSIADGTIEPDNGHTRRVQQTNELLEPAITSIASTWEDCESITHELTGRYIEMGYLELIMPMFRIAHVYMDSDGRQVGEANVFPPALRLDIKTQWRSCHYAGSRYQSERLMNSTALRVMSKHWSEMMLCIKHVRDAYFARYQKPGDIMTLGDLERLTVMVLALPTFCLLRANNPVVNGKLHPVLSSVFRVTDGVRLTAHQMLFLPTDEVRSQDPNTQICSEDIYAYAEKNNSFYSQHGVCAGPRMMIEQLLNVLVSGKLENDAINAQLSVPVKQALADIEPAIDYGLRSLQAFAIVHSLFTVMAGALHKLIKFSLALPDNDSVEMLTFKNRMKQSDAALVDSLLGTAERRSDREKIYADMFHQCSLGLSEGESFHKKVNPGQPQPHCEFSRLLAEAIDRKISKLNMSDVELQSARARMDELVNSLTQYFYYEQSVLEAGSAVQHCINRMVGRDDARRPLHAADLMASVAMNNERGQARPNIDDQLLSTEIYDLFHLRIQVTSDDIECIDCLSEHPDRQMGDTL